MTGYLLSPAAQADLGEIRDYSARRWGAAPAATFSAFVTPARLADGSRQGRSVDSIRPGYRKLAVASHILFYRVADTGMIDVVRILHRKMDVAAQLPPKR